MEFAKLLEQHVARNADTFVVDEISSTNTELLRRCKLGMLARPTILLTHHQSGGKGTRGRSWVQTANRDLAMTLGLAQEGECLSDPRLSLAVGAILAGALERELAGQLKPGENAGKPAIAVKWPNDLLAWTTLPGEEGHWRKLGGILIETCDGPQNQRWLFVGAGININSRLADFPAQLRHRLTTLHELLGRELDRAHLTAALAGALAREMTELANPDCDGSSRLNALIEQWMKRHRTAGTRYRLTRAGQQVQVEAIDVNPVTGELICVDEMGKTYGVSSYSELDAFE